MHADQIRSLRPAMTAFALNADVAVQTIQDFLQLIKRDHTPVNARASRIQHALSHA